MLYICIGPVSTTFSTSTKLAAAQSELQACETHLASKESELAIKRSAAVREGLATRAKAMIQCSRIWEQLGKEILSSLDDLGIIDGHRNGIYIKIHVCFPCLPFFLLERAPSMPIPLPAEGPSSDFSSIGPSQSASQINYQFPEPTKLAPNTNPEILGQQQQPISDLGLVPPMPRRHSIASTVASSLYHTPAMPATYTKESVKYAPAISLVVPASLPSSPRDINAPLASFDVGLPPPIGYASETLATTTTTTMYIPAAHAISEYEMPTAKVSETGSVGSGTFTGWRHSRGESQSREELPFQRTSLGASGPVAGSTSGPILSNTAAATSSTINRDGGGGQQQTVVVPTRVGSVLVEVFEDPEDNEEEEEEEEEEEGDDSELPVEVEDQLIKQGKLAVVENPRFMSEERKKELEREREKWTTKQPSDTTEKGQQQQLQTMSETVPEPEPEPDLEPEEKKSFSFLQQHKRTGTQDTSGRVTFAPVSPSSAIPSTPTKISPSKATAAAGENLSPSSNSLPYKISPSKRFFGSLKGLFVGTRPAASPREAPSQVHQDSSSSPVLPPSRFRDDRSPSRNPMNDDSDNESPTKTRSGFQAFLLGTNAAKKRDGSSTTGGGTTRWSTRTDRNIRKLTSGGADDDDDEYDTFLSRDVRNNGVAGDIVGRAGLVDGGVTGSRGGVGKKRSTSGTAAAPIDGSTVSATGGGGKKLKKTAPPPIAAAAPTPSAFHATSSTQRIDPTTTVQAHTPDPSTALRRKSSVKTGEVPRRRSASVDESMRRRTTNVAVEQQGVGEVGQQTTPSGDGKEVVVDLGKRRRVNSVIPATNPPPVGASARGIPATTRTPAAGTSVVSKGYSSDTAAARAPPTVTPAATATPSKPTSSKPTPTRQPSVGKTQTHPTSNPHVAENIGGSRQHPPQPQPHRQHSASSSGGGAIVLTAGGTQPTGTLISRPGWDAQALPTAGGGLSRNNSILSGVSGAAGGSSSGGGAGGGVSKKKKQRQTTLGHGMGSGTSIGRRSSLGSSSGYGGGGGGGPVVQPSQPAQSLMSIVEDVAKHNREWSQESSQLLKNRNKIVSGGGLEKDKMGVVGGMVDVARAPRRFGRDELAQLDPAMIKARVMETSTTTNMHLAPAATGASGSGGRMFDIKAPGSVFDQRDTTATVGSAPVRPKVYRQPSNSTPDLTQNQQDNVARRPSVAAGPVATSTPVARSKRPAKSPLRSAMKNPSRTPSPLTSPFLVPHLQKQQQALQEGSRHAVKSNVVGVVAPVPVPPAQHSTILGPQQQSSSHPPSTSTIAATDIRPTTMTNGRADFASQRRKGKRQVRSASDEVVGEEAGDSTSTNDTGNEIFYTDDEDDDHHHDEAPPLMLNGHAVGYAGSSDLSYSTTSTAAVAHRLPPTTTSPDTSQPITTRNVARRRKSVRVSLQPTFSPSPPAVEYDDDKEEQPWVWKQDHHHHTTEVQQQLHVHAPVPVAAGSSLLLNPVHHRQKVVAPPTEPSARVYDMWEDSDEDVEYQNAKLLLTRAAKKEKDMNVIAARSRS